MRIPTTAPVFEHASAARTCPFCDRTLEADILNIPICPDASCRFHRPTRELRGAPRGGRHG